MVRIQAKVMRNIDKVTPSEKCYEGASALGQLQFVNEGYGWMIRTATLASLMGPAMTLALGLTECCAQLGRGKVFWFTKHSLGREVKLPWTPTTTRIPSLLYADFVWDDTTRNQWFNTPHWGRLDALNARGHALDLQIPTMPITLTYDMDNYSNMRANDGLAPIALLHNSSGYTYLGFTADMSLHMTYKGGSTNGYYWQAEKTALAQFKMFSGPLVATRLQSMYREARPETFMFLRTLIAEAIKGHDEWVGNGGYTIEGDSTLGPTLARQFRAAIQAQGLGVQAQGVGVQAQEQLGDRLRELRNLTSAWVLHKRGSLQDFIDVMNTSVGIDIARFTIFNAGWSRLSLNEQGLALELYELEDEYDRRNPESDEET